MLIQKKITTYLILTLLLLTSTGSAFGVVYCDAGCLSEIHHNNHHSDESHEAFGEDFAVSLDQQLKINDDSCLDFPLELVNGLIHKEIAKCPTNTSLYLPFETSINAVNILLYVYNPYKKNPPEISQNILAHRNVVLLI